MEVIDLGSIAYDSAWQLQKDRQCGLISKTADEAIFICEHPATITLGNSADESNILVTADQLAQSKIQTFRIERGGDVTFHGPGQMVVYPILDLRLRRADVGWYLRSLEQCIIDALSAGGIAAERISGKTGVWVRDQDTLSASEPRKIASIGIRISRWCTLHGLALYLAPQQEGFRLINPCGMPGVQVVSVAELGGDPLQVKNALISALLTAFQLPSTSLPDSPN